jgi:hypothetical protein
LKPFLPTCPLSHLKITGNIGRRSGTLSIIYALGPLDEVLITAPAGPPVRRKALWEETCFELFLGVKNSDYYWEFNLSPAEHWNVYRFKAYRHGMQEENAFKSLPLSVRIEPEVLKLSLDLDLDKIVPADSSLKVGISAVIKSANGELTYWALTHPGPQPDFHRRDSFIVEL